jgi:hypothetical protein
LAFLKALVKAAVAGRFLDGGGDEQSIGSSDAVVGTAGVAAAATFFGDGPTTVNGLKHRYISRSRKFTKI